MIVNRDEIYAVMNNLVFDAIVSAIDSDQDTEITHDEVLDALYEQLKTEVFAEMSFKHADSDALIASQTTQTDTKSKRK